MTYHKRDTPNAEFFFTWGEIPCEKEKNRFFRSSVNHLGNVLEVVTDRKLAIEDEITAGEVAHYTADVVAQSDYFPFGMLMANTSGMPDEVDYRYAFNGMEKDDEVSGNDNSYNFGARFYNPRVGRFLSRDPREKQYPFWAPYIYAVNNPILWIDENGEGPILPFLSRQVSQENIRPLIESYNAGEISYADLHGVMVNYMNTGFTDWESMDYASRMLEKSGIDFEKTAYADNGYYSYVSPPVLYDGGMINDLYTYVTLIDTDKDGNWIQKEYKIFNETLYNEKMTALDKEMCDIENQITELDSRIESKKRWIEGDIALIAEYSNKNAGAAIKNGKIVVGGGASAQFTDGRVGATLGHSITLGWRTNQLYDMLDEQEKLLNTRDEINKEIKTTQGQKNNGKVELTKVTPSANKSNNKVEKSNNKGESKSKSHSHQI